MSAADDSNVTHLADRVKNAGPIVCLRAYLAFTRSMADYFEQCERQSAKLPTHPDHITLSRLFHDTAVRARECAEIWRAQGAHAEWLLKKYTQQPDPAA